ncbi:MAG TPA: glycosyltransferase [Candidatus Sumerlaeota bacterium]|nr:glycosyltransferase [Candidatus Sumerlaeota bacterium]HRR32103.1 glycosyltransferase [Candidatus Sumerlaeia bacterium]HON49338.1 glycosyltransferase [Candidatus Sumerlaeota bacterium]HOR64914.1 glycosyltransferase [Candidatus Sumerlaeota bacterium]HPL73067.1 glycosyltransferase [Candidatus Sumerlaeota bacterium]
MNGAEKKVIVVGVGPVPRDGALTKVYAPGLRLFAFSQYIHEAGFRVIMGERMFESEHKESTGEPLPWETRLLSFDGDECADAIAEWAQREKPIAIVSTTDVINRAAARAKVQIEPKSAAPPLWLDINGHPMAERQELSRVHSSDAGLIEQWKYLIPALLAGDHFSVCSTPQKYALIGELGALGRLNQWTSGCDLVSVIPPAPVFHEQPPAANTKPPEIISQLNETDFMLLWTGGFNTWVDEKTLFEGVEKAMKQNASIQFVLTGGAIQGHDERTFQKFKARIETSPFKERFRFAGWVSLEDLAAYYKRAEKKGAAINCDLFSYEALLGCRNRLFSWARFGVPIITTALSEITCLLAERNLAQTFPAENADALANALLKLAGEPEAGRNMATRAKKFFDEEYQYKILTTPLIEWLQNPQPAPDSGRRNELYDAQEALLAPRESCLKRIFQRLKKTIMPF